MLRCPLDEREEYAGSARLALNLMSNSLADLTSSPNASDKAALAALFDPIVNGAKIIDTLVVRGHALVKNALRAEMKHQRNCLRFSTLATTQFSLIIDKLTSDAANEQKRLSEFAMMTTFAGSIILALLVVAH